MTADHAVFEAIGRLRDVARGLAARDLGRERDDWRRVESFVRRTRHAQGRDADDVVQEALVAIARHVAELEARDESGVLAWLTRIVHHKKIDGLRTRAREGTVVSGPEDGPSAVEQLERDDGQPVDDHALATLIEAVEEAIGAKVDGLGLPAMDRQLRRVQARATLHRVLGAETSEVRAVLGLDASVGADRLAKWVERGRPLLVSVLEGLAWDHEGDAREVFLALRERAMARRADAGRSRPGRRKGPGDGAGDGAGDGGGEP